MALTKKTSSLWWARFHFLIRVAESDSDIEMKKQALFWIGQSGMPNRLAMLEDIYKNSMDSSQIRNQVLFALSRTREPQAATILGTVASSDPDIDVRRQAAFWLGHMRIPEATQTLENLLRKK